MTGATAQRVFSASVPPSTFRKLFGEAEAPLMLFDFAAYFDCSLPREKRLLVLVETGAGRILPVPDSTLAALAVAVGAGRLRVEESLYRGALAAARAHLAQRLTSPVAELEAAIAAERDRRRRRLDTVFDLRLAEADTGDEATAAEDVARLLNGKRLAVRHAEAHYDPESLRVSLETELVLLLGVGS